MKPTCKRCGSINMEKGKWHLSYHEDRKFRYYHCKSGSYTGIINVCTGLSEIQVSELRILDKILIKLGKLK